MSSRKPTPVRNRVVGIATVAVFIGLAVFAYKFYKGDLSPGVRVTLTTARAGLLLDPGSKVALNGLKVGTVRSVVSEGGEAVITMDIDPEQARTLPANVTADLRPTTLFGAKYVALVLPERPGVSHLVQGDEIVQRSGAQEADQVFENVMNLLTEVQPEKINATLTALSGALDGRGEQLGQTITQFNTYLTGILPSIPQLNRDLARANAVLPTYRQAAPDLVQAMDNFRTTSRTLTTRRGAISEMLSGLTKTGGDSTALLIDAGAPLTRTVTELKPTTYQLARYSPEYTCLLQGMANMQNRPELGPPVPYEGFNGTASFLPRARPYEYPQDLPKVAADSGPNCFGLPLLKKDSYFPHYDFDVGRSPFRDGVPMKGKG